MNGSTPLYRQLLGFFSQYSQAKDWQHLKTLSWMVSALIGSGKLSLPEWEPYVVSIATQSQSYERRWRRFLNNGQIDVERIYLPLVMAALSGWKQHRLYLAIDTTMRWNQYCMIHLSVVCCGRAIPLRWHVLEQESATVAILYATTTGLTVQFAGLRTTIDPHWRRGLSYLKIGLRYLRGVISKGRKLLIPTPLRSRDPEPCFPNPKAELDFSGLIWFSRISTITCNS
jgi:hypothetical protein